MFELFFKTNANDNEASTSSCETVLLQCQQLESTNLDLPIVSVTNLF